MRIMVVPFDDQINELLRPENSLSPGDPTFEVSAQEYKLFVFCISFSTLRLINLRT